VLTDAIFLVATPNLENLVSNANIWRRNVFLATTQNGRKRRLYLRKPHSMLCCLRSAQRCLWRRWLLRHLPRACATQVLPLVPTGRLRLHRPRQEATACVQPAASEQVGAAAGGSGYHASSSLARLSLLRKTSPLSRIMFVLRTIR
jgi:hypothetical protein